MDITRKYVKQFINEANENSYDKPPYTPITSADKISEKQALEYINDAGNHFTETAKEVMDYISKQDKKQDLMLQNCREAK